MEKSHVEPVFENFFAQISPEIAATFTDEQVQALARVLPAYLISISLIFAYRCRYFAVILLCWLVEKSAL